MTEPGESEQRAVYEVTCPHCKKVFRSELISGATARYQGFKCPYCRLFVPRERAGAPRYTAAAS